MFAAKNQLIAVFSFWLVLAPAASAAAQSAFQPPRGSQLRTQLLDAVRLRTLPVANPQLHLLPTRSPPGGVRLGLRIGDSQDQIIGLYGEPNSSGPATKNGQELALMYYQFDWAGSDVPQVMEVLCARDTGRVVEITLAFPSL